MSPSPLCATRHVPSPTTGERAVRVLQVAPRFFPELGGIETHINEVTTRLAALPDIRVTVAVTDRSRTLPTCEMWGDVPILRRQAWPKDRDFYFSPGLARIISHGQWDIVHVQGVHTLVPVLAMRAAARANIPYVLTFHTGGSSLLSRRVMRSTQWRALGPLLRRSSQMVAVSRFEQRLFARSTGVSEDRIKVIRNGAGLPIANSETVPVPGRIVSCGRLERYKGHHRVMKLLPRIQRQLPEAHLHILGSGPYEARLRALASRLGVSQSVTIREIPPSNRNEMATSLAQASVVVALSDYEAHPVSVMEALALARPVVGFEVAGMSDLVEDGLVTGVSPKASVAQLAQTIVAAIRSPNRLLSRPTRLPTWEATADQLADIYRSIATSRAEREGAGFCLR
jgi:glycosyltransferase involved in cell wall biosynthesis